MRQRPANLFPTSRSHPRWAFATVNDRRVEPSSELFHAVVAARGVTGEANRLTRVRSWQEIRREGKWVPLTEGECIAGKRRNIAPRDIRLKLGYHQMIAAFLRSEPVQAAQERLIARRGRLALQRSTCWASAMQRERPTFREFLFFFDYLIQNGDSFTKDGSLQNVAARMQVPNDTKLGKDGQARLKMIQLKLAYVGLLRAMLGNNE